MVEFTTSLEVMPAISVVANTTPSTDAVKPTPVEDPELILTIKVIDRPVLLVQFVASDLLDETSVQVCPTPIGTTAAANIASVTTALLPEETTVPVSSGNVRVLSVLELGEATVKMPVPEA